MAIVASNLYSGRVVTGDSGYPLGKAQDIVNGEKGTGTPLRASWVNDQWGFLQALLDAADITPSGTPDQVGQSDYLDAVNKLIREPLALKIFQSPSSEGLTEIQTRTVNTGEVYEVRKTSDDSLATIYSDAEGTTEIVQNGTSNVSGSSGVVGFFVAIGDYYIEVNSVKGNFSTGAYQAKLEQGGNAQDAIKQLTPQMFSGADDNERVSKMFAAATSGSVVDFQGLSYTLRSGEISVSNLDNLKVKGGGAILNESGQTINDMFVFDSCKNLRVSGFTPIGSETLAYWQSTDPSDRCYFFRLNSCNKGKVWDINASNKRGGVILKDCIATTTHELWMEGFLPSVSEGVVSGANQILNVELSGGSRCRVYNIDSENCGSSVLVGRDSIAPTIFGVTGNNLHDNVVYVSSGTRARVFAVDGEDIGGNTVKIRGSQNIAALNTSKRTYGSAFSMTGNGIAADSDGANGFGNITALNSANEIALGGVGDGVTAGGQDGLLQRDSIVALNAMQKLRSTGGFGFVRTSMVRGGAICLNACHDFDTDSGMVISGTVGNNFFNSTIALNNVSGKSAFSLRDYLVNYTENSVVLGNTGSNSGVMGALTNSAGVVVNSNCNNSGTRAFTLTSTDNCMLNGNVGSAGVISGQGCAIGVNIPNSDENITVNSPSFINQVTVSSGLPYIATGISSPVDWKQIVTV